MNIIDTAIDGVKRIETKIVHDDRGSLIKVFHKDTFVKAGLAYDFVESYYSISKPNVIRGMHFQIPPQDHAKLIYVSAGAILDVILDVRQGSPSYGKSITLELNDMNRHAIYVPTGCAHGFTALQENSIVTYLQTTMYAPGHEGGIRYDSFGLDWNVPNPIVSPRDQAFPAFKDFTSPFRNQPALSS